MRPKIAVFSGVLLGILGLPLVFAAAALAVLVVAAPVYSLPGLMIIASLLLLVGSLGGVGGGIAAWLLTSDGHRRYIQRLAAAFLLLCAVGLLGGAALAIRTYRVEFAETDIWIKGKREAMNEADATALAREIQRCASGHTAERMMTALYGECAIGRTLDTPVGITPETRARDSGWRWHHAAGTADWLIEIRPAVDLELPGPIFELHADGRLLRREHRDAPAVRIH